MSGYASFHRDEGQFPLQGSVFVIQPLFFLCCLGLITLEDYSQQYGRKYEDNAHHCEESC